MAIPKVTPSGFLCPPVTVDERTIGKSGHIHGAKIVTRPEIKAKIKRININFKYTIKINTPCF